MSHSIQQVILETSLSRQSIALVLTTKNKETQHYIHPKHKREMVKTALANKTNYTLVWYTFYDLPLGNGVGCILTALEPTQDLNILENGMHNLCIISKKLACIIVRSVAHHFRKNLHIIPSSLLQTVVHSSAQNSRYNLSSYLTDSYIVFICLMVRFFSITARMLSAGAGDFDFSDQ